MALLSAGILLYRRRGRGLELLLIRPGGPFWRGRDAGAWMIPKGGVDPGEAPLAAALREFREELGSRADGTPRPLARIRQAGGKWVEAFALEGDLDCSKVTSERFTIEYPPRSGQYRDFPEVEEARWFSPAEAREKMLPSQIPLLDALEAQLAEAEGG